MLKSIYHQVSLIFRIVVVSLIFTTLAPILPARADAVVGNPCGETELLAAIAAGGTITFSCDGIIAVSPAIRISTSITIDAKGHNIVLDGGGLNRIFIVDPGVTLTLVNLTLQNGSFGTGGAIGTRGGTLIIKNSRFLNNASTGSAGSGGGAIFADVDSANPNFPTRITIENSLFENNTSAGQGGAIFIDGGEVNVPIGGYLNIKNSTFRNNRTTGSGDGGAILANYHITLNAEGSLFANNTARGDGGAIAMILSDDIANLTNNTFSGNVANSDSSGGSGGALSLRNSYLVHNTFYGNSVVNTGPVYQGNAIAWGSNSFSVVMRDNIFHANTGGLYECMSSFSYALYGNGNLTDDGSCNGGTVSDPVTHFDTVLADHGGPTQTHALQNLSNAIDASTDCTYSSSGENPLFIDGDAILRDQRGAARPSGAACDKGAYEVRPSVSVENCGVAELSGLQTLTLSDGSLMSFDVVTANGLTCITVEELGRAHELGTEDIKASGVWWRFTGNIDNGFDVDITVPAENVPDSGDQICRYSGDKTTITWTCGVTSYDATSLTLENVSQFSDWSISEDQDPTAVELTALTAHGRISDWGLFPVFGLILIASLIFLQHRKS
jgi:hypothetical protein